MPRVVCACACGCRIARTLPRAMVGMSCYPCGVGHHNLAATGYPVAVRRHRVGTNPIGLDAPGTSPGVNAAPGGLPE